jgi:hypothetical protein
MMIGLMVNVSHLNTHYFDITYTAGRRKKIEGGYSAKKATEILLYKTDAVEHKDIVTVEELAQAPTQEGN